MHTEHTINGVVYIDHPYCCMGDYGGSGDVGEANRRSVLEMANEAGLDVGYYYAQTLYRMEEWPRDEWEYPTENVLDIYGSYGHKAVWFRKDWDEAEDILAALDDYPLLDEDLNSQVTMEWEDEAWESWVESDLYSTLDEDTQEALDERTDPDTWKCYREAMEECNEYPVMEHSGAYIDVKRIAEAYGNAIREMLNG
jgi:hypothetical protein